MSTTAALQVESAGLAMLPVSSSWQGARGTRGTPRKDSTVSLGQELPDLPPNETETLG